MGTIVARQRKDGSASYLAKISIMRDGAIVHRESKTFDRRPFAAAWIDKRERELSMPGAIDRLNASHITLSHAIDRYISETGRDMGKTKAQVLEAIKKHPIASKQCADIKSEDIVSFARDLSPDRQAQTVGNYISHLASIFAIAKPAWGYDLDRQAMADARVVMARLGTIAKSSQRDRRPTLQELDQLMQHFQERSQRRINTAPMCHIVAFALFSTRRQDEILRITWEDLDVTGSRILVKDMKHPGQKRGNNVWCELPPEALAIALAMPKTDPRIFPYSTDAISAAFTRVCKFLMIEDLHFHDLRHEGVSRLFEMGRTIPQAASVSGHRSWHSLQRYSHIRQTGDKYAGWPWLRLVTETPAMK